MVAECYRRTRDLLASERLKGPQCRPSTSVCVCVFVYSSIDFVALSLTDRVRAANVGARVQHQAACVRRRRRPPHRCPAIRERTGKSCEKSLMLRCIIFFHCCLCGNGRDTLGGLAKCCYCDVDGYVDMRPYSQTYIHPYIYTYIHTRIYFYFVSNHAGVARLCRAQQSVTRALRLCRECVPSLAALHRVAARQLELVQDALAQHDANSLYDRMADVDDMLPTKAGTAMEAVGNFAALDGVDADLFLVWSPCRAVIASALHVRASCC